MSLTCDPRRQDLVTDAMDVGRRHTSPETAQVAGGVRRNQFLFGLLLGSVSSDEESNHLTQWSITTLRSGVVEVFPVKDQPGELPLQWNVLGEPYPDHEVALGPGQGHVRESPLLGRDASDGQQLASTRVPPRQRGTSVDDVRIGRHPTTDRVRPVRVDFRESLVQEGNKDRIELQALGLVDRHDPDGVALSLQAPCLDGLVDTLLLGRSIEPLQEEGQ